MRHRRNRKLNQQDPNAPPPAVFEQEDWKERLRTIGKLIEGYTLPLWGRRTREDARPEIKGSGLLLKIADAHFLLTAAHVAHLSGHDGESLCFRKYRNKMEFMGLPDKTGYAYLTDPLDIAVIRLPEEIAANIDPFHKFASLDLLDPSDRLAPQPSPYMAFGYLSKLSGPGVVNYQTYSMFYFSAKYRGDDKAIPAFTHRAHIAIELQDERSTDLDGFKHELPELGGASGSGLWRTGEGAVDHDNPVGSLRLVGVTIRWNKKPQLIIGTQIEGVLALISQAYPDLKRSIDLHVGTTWKRRGWTPRFKL